MAKRRLSQQQISRIRQAQDSRRQRAAERSGKKAEALSASGLGPEQTGLVIANYGPTAIVEDAAGVLFRCALRQNMEPLVCGDQVIWQASSEDEGVVVAVQERRSLLLRPDYSGRLKPMAANLDQVAVVIALRPELNVFLIDRYLAAIATIGVDALLILNKIDLLDATTRQALQARLATYEKIGYPLLLASTKTEHGLAAVQARLQDRCSILAGQSGVGKSSLIKALLPDRDIRIRSLSQATGLGTHTTTTSTLYHLPAGGDMIDSPGVRSFELGPISLGQLEHGFVEFRAYLGQCRFSNCSHTVEPNCALKAAIADGEIDPRRLESFQQIKAGLAE